MTGDVDGVPWAHGVRAMTTWGWGIQNTIETHISDRSAAGSMNFHLPSHLNKWRYGFLVSSGRASFDWLREKLTVTFAVRRVRARTRLKRRHRNSRLFFVAGSVSRFIGAPTLDRRTPRASQTHSNRYEMSAFTVATSAIGTSPASRVPFAGGSRPAPVAHSAPCAFQIGFVRFRRVFIPSPSGLPALALRDTSAIPGRRRGGGGFGVRAMTSNPTRVRIRGERRVPCSSALS